MSERFTVAAVGTGIRVASERRVTERDALRLVAKAKAKGCTRCVVTRDGVAFWTGTRTAGGEWVQG
jgi:hypothetical protein